MFTAWPMTLLATPEIASCTAGTLEMDCAIELIAGDSPAAMPRVIAVAATAFQFICARPPSSTANAPMAACENRLLNAPPTVPAITACVVPTDAAPATGAVVAATYHDMIMKATMTTIIIACAQRSGPGGFHTTAMCGVMSPSARWALNGLYTSALFDSATTV